MDGWVAGFGFEDRGGVAAQAEADGDDAAESEEAVDGDGGEHAAGNDGGGVLDLFSHVGCGFAT